MNLSIMIDRILYMISEKHKVFYMEQITYKDKKKYKSYKIKIDKTNKEFNNKTQLLLFLKDWK